MLPMIGHTQRVRDGGRGDEIPESVNNCGDNRKNASKYAKQAQMNHSMCEMRISITQQTQQQSSAMWMIGVVAVVHFGIFIRQ